MWKGKYGCCFCYFCLTGLIFPEITPVRLDTMKNIWRSAVREFYRPDHFPSPNHLYVIAILYVPCCIQSAFIQQILYCIILSKQRMHRPIIALKQDVITLHASCGVVYCNRSCLFVAGCVCLWVCYHDNSKLHASILTKLGL